MNEKKCNKECDGIIKEMIIKGIDFPSIISVEYKVNGKIYILKENLVMKKEKNIMLGFIPVGYSLYSALPIYTERLVSGVTATRQSATASGQPVKSSKPPKADRSTLKKWRT